MIASSKYLSGMGFYLILTVFENFESRHQFSLVEKSLNFSFLSKIFNLLRFC
eukprot:UN20604